jgi:PKD repeat protein
VPGYKNETFYTSPQEEGDHVNNARMTDLFFGPYKNTQALYIIKYGSLDTVIRIRYTGSVDQAPTALFTVDGENFLAGESIQFDGSQSSDPGGDPLSFEWDFGDGSTSDLESPTHAYSELGEYLVTLVVTDTAGQSHQLSRLIVVGQPPEAVIISPSIGDVFFVGEVLLLKGVAYDNTGKEISNENIEWEVQQHHAGKLLQYLLPVIISHQHQCSFV